MKEKIENVLKDLFSADPSLREREEELRQVVEVLLSSKPDVDIDDAFKEKLREDLLLQFPQSQMKKKSGVSWMRSWKGGLAVAGAAAAVLAVVGVMASMHFGKKSAMEESLSATASDDTERLAEMQVLKTMLSETTPSSSQTSTEELKHRLQDSPMAGLRQGQEYGIKGPYETGPGFETEAYDRIYENMFLETVKNPLSTFSIDVDTASYANVRRFIKNGQKPYADAVRIEELINYFSYDYPEPKGVDPFSFSTEISDCPWNAGHKLIHVGLQGKRVPMENLPPGNLVFLIDVSGSMNQMNKLPLLKSAFRLLVDQMRPNDRVAIVVYAGAAGLVLPSTPGSAKATILAAIEELQAGGSTAGGAGIKLAYKVAAENFDSRGNNRVILATDGDFNVGPSSDAEMVRLIEEKRKEGIFLTVLGFGMGNYKDSKMEKLADKGNGNYAYIDSLMEAKKVLVSELGGTLFTIAKDVKIQVEFNPAKVKAYRLVGYENRIMKAEEFDDDKKDAGELGSGHSVTALYEIVLAEGGVSTGHDLKYQTVHVKEEAAQSNEIATIKFRYKRPDEKESKLLVHPIFDEKVSIQETSDNFRFSAAVAAWGMLLRDSEFKGSADFDQVTELAKGAVGKDQEGYRAEFIHLVAMSKNLYK